MIISKLFVGTQVFDYFITPSMSRAQVVAGAPGEKFPQPFEGRNIVKVLFVTPSKFVCLCLLKIFSPLRATFWPRSGQCHCPSTVKAVCYRGNSCDAATFRISFNNVPIKKVYLHSLLLQYTALQSNVWRKIPESLNDEEQFQRWEKHKWIKLTQTQMNKTNKMKKTKDTKK